MCFLLPKCVFLYQWCLKKVVYHGFHHANMCLSLLWNSVGKKNTHTLPIYDLNFPLPKCCIFTLAFLWYCTKSLVSLDVQKNNLKGTTLKLPPGLAHPGPCKPGFLKKTPSLPALFCCTDFPGGVHHWHCLLIV